MSSFNAKPESMIKASEQLGRCSNRLQRCSYDIRQVQYHLGLESSAVPTLKRAIRQVSDSVLEDAVKMDSLKEALESIANIYRNTENKLVNQETDTADYGLGASSDSQRIGFVAANYWDLLLQFIKYRDNKDKLAEALNDRYMSYTAQNMLNRPEYSEKTWKKATLEERKAMLQGLLNELNTLMGLNVTQYDFKPIEGSTRGYYDPDTNSVTVNLNLIDPANNNASSYMAMRTMIHEMRHAYQYAAIEHPEQYYVSEETRRQWAENFKKGNYKNATQYGYKAYVEQPVEYDAKRFAGQYQDILGYTPTYKGTW